jgi:hypothetical protein
MKVSHPSSSTNKWNQTVAHVCMSEPASCARRKAGSGSTCKLSGISRVLWIRASNWMISLAEIGRPVLLVDDCEAL